MIAAMATSASRPTLREGSAVHNLPLPLTSLVGRGRELERVGETLRRTRLVSITGPGGVGKTRLALELAQRQVPRRPDGVWLVDLALGTEAPDVPAEVARALGLQSNRRTEPTEALRRYLRDRDLLIVLDNCEHIVDACAELATSVLESCAAVRIMATSRESLGVNGETVWRLAPLGSEDAYRQRRADDRPAVRTARLPAACDRARRRARRGDVAGGDPAEPRRRRGRARRP